MAKPDWITLSKSSGSGNGTVTVTAAKNTSTTARSGSITVKSGSLSKVVTISQEGQSAQASGLITLSYTGTLPVYDYSGETFYLSVDSNDTAEFYQPAGTIKSAGNGSMVIDISDLSKSDIDRIHGDLYNGDMIEMDEIFFGVSPEEDPEASWKAVLKTTQTGGYVYTSQYVAECWLAAYNGEDSNITCSVIGGTASSDTYLTVSAKMCDINVLESVFSEIGMSSLNFFIELKLTNGVTVDSDSIITLNAPTMGEDYVEGKLWLEVENVYVPSGVSIEGFYIKCFEGSDSSNIYPILEGESNIDYSTCQNDTTLQSYNATFSSGSTYDLGFRFMGTRPLFSGNDNTDGLTFLNDPTITITGIG